MRVPARCWPLAIDGLVVAASQLRGRCGEPREWLGGKAPTALHPREGPHASEEMVENSAARSTLPPQHNTPIVSPGTGR
jgi:hypothetical protein